MAMRTITLTYNEDSQCKHCGEFLTEWFALEVNRQLRIGDGELEKRAAKFDMRCRKCGSFNLVDVIDTKDF